MALGCGRQRYCHAGLARHLARGVGVSASEHSLGDWNGRTATDGLSRLRPDPSGRERGPGLRLPIRAATA
jgi:hypothetical protein